MRTGDGSIVAGVDLLVTHPKSGKRTGLAATVRCALAALNRAEVPYCVIGATALAVRGLPRMTRNLDVAVLLDDAPAAWDALRGAGLEASTPTGSREEPESMVVFVDGKSGVEVDLLAAAGDPEALVGETPQSPSPDKATLIQLLTCQPLRECK